VFVQKCLLRLLRTLLNDPGDVSQPHRDSREATEGSRKKEGKMHERRKGEGAPW
jgi:hypothetical protein